MAGKNRKRKSTRSKTRRASGTGALFFSEARGVWIGRVAVGKNADGSPHYVERSHRDQAVVVERLKKAEPPGSTITVAEYATRWLKEMRVRSRTTEIRAGNVRNHIVPVLGGAKICDLTHGQIERAARIWGDSVGSNTVRLIIDQLGTMLAEAVREGLRSDNPIKLVRRPKAVKKKIDPFTIAELTSIITEGGTLSRGRVVSLLAGTGLRVGEALALDVEDYDPSANSLSITKTSSLKRVTGPPKSANGIRAVYPPPACTPMILAAIGSRKSGPLLASKSGGRIGHDAVSRVFKLIQKRLGLRHRNPHQLRHSVATNAIAAGVHIGNVARDLGDTPETIVKTYLHATEGESVFDAMSRLLNRSESGRM